jgi:hemoglobin
LSRPDTGLTEQRIAVLVDRFYDKVRVHPTLGPVFNAVVADWDAHKRLLVSFWSSVALGTRNYHGNPLAKHRPLPIDNAHFEQWLALWAETTQELLDDASAALLIGYAQRIAASLRMGIGLAYRPRGRESGVPILSPPS